MTAETVHPLCAVSKRRVGAIGGLQNCMSDRYRRGDLSGEDTDCDENERHDETASTGAHPGEEEQGREDL